MPIQAIKFPGARYPTYQVLASLWQDADDVVFVNNVTLLARIKLASASASEVLQVTPYLDFQGRTYIGTPDQQTVTKANGMAFFGPFGAKQGWNANGLLIVDPISTTDIEIIAVRDFFNTYV